MIDLAPLVNQVVIPLALPVLTAAGSWAAIKVAGFFHIQIQDSQRALVDDVIYRAIRYASAKVAPTELQVTTGNQMTDVAATYVTQHVPGALRSLGVTPDALRRMVEARLPTGPATVELTTPPY